MAKLTLLEIVQDILNDLDSDEVNSIDDTVESYQVAQIVKTTYYELIDNRPWPHLKSLGVLDSVSDTARPTHLKLPSNTKELVWFNYNNRRVTDDRDKYMNIMYLYPDEFIAKSNARNNSEDNIDVVTDFGGAKFNIRNDIPPTYWTSFDDDYIVLDSYDKAVDTTVQGSKTQVSIYRDPSFSLTDDHTPDLPSEAFSLLVAEAKSVAFSVLKQIANQKAEQQSQRQNRWLSRKSWKAAGGVRYPNYGRGGKGRVRNNPQFDKDSKIP